MTTASTRIWTFAAAMLMIVVVALGWFLGASPKLADAARFDAERRSVEAQNDLARATIAQLEADFAQIDDLRDDLRLLRSEFPTQAEYDTVIEAFLRGMITEGLVLQNVVVNEPAPTSAVAPAEGEQPVVEVDGDGELPTGSLLRVTASITVAGSLDQLLAYIDRLQMSPRFTIIPTASFSQGSNPEGRAMSISLIMYVVTGDLLPEVEQTDSPDSEADPQPTDTPTPEATDPAATEPPPTPTPTP